MWDGAFCKTIYRLLMRTTIPNELSFTMMFEYRAFGETPEIRTPDTLLKRLDGV